MTFEGHTINGVYFEYTRLKVTIGLRCPRCANTNFTEFHNLVKHYASCDGIDYQTIEKEKMILENERMKALVRCGLMPDGYGNYVSWGISPVERARRLGLI